MPRCEPPLQPAPHPGRYHAAGDPWPLYAALDEATTWAEWRHATGGAVSPADDPRWLCTFDADLSVLDLRSPEVRDRLGVTSADLVAPWSPGSPNEACGRVMAAAIAAGADAVIVPSAARPDGWNIAVLPGAFARLRLVSRRRHTPEIEAP